MYAHINSRPCTVTLFQRSVKDELTSHASVVFSTLVVIWISVLMIRLLGEAAAGRIGADVVMGITAFSSITALSTILAVAAFIAVLTTVSRNYRESEMVVWFSSGLSLLDWIRPILRFAIPVAALIAVLTLGAAPWAQRQIADYRTRYAQRSDVSKVTPGQFLESSGADRVFYVESASDSMDQVSNVFARWIDNSGMLNILVSGGGKQETAANGDRFMVLDQGQRYTLKPGTPQFRLMRFDKYGVRMERKASGKVDETPIKSASTMSLVTERGFGWLGELLWRVSMPLLAINLALLAIPLGAVNPRLGRSGDTVIALLVAFFYLNMVNLTKAWVNNGKLNVVVAFIVLHGVVTLLAAGLLYMRLRVRVPKG